MKLFKKSLTSLTMNNLVILPFLIGLLPLFPASHGPALEHASVDIAILTPSPGEKYVIDKKESSIVWSASMAIASKGGHSGFVYLSKGEMLIDKNQLVGGSVEVDMNTIEDEKHGKDNSLIDHLKDPDFFDVKKYPTSTFVITKVAPGLDGSVDITGKLTIKGVTNEVTFPASLEVNKGVLTANGKLVIDRTLWDVWFKSGKFFTSLADDFISDHIYFEMNIVAKKIK